ncbi:choice-of-anchor D domain-containing protein [Winogradskyella wichelsiae]|uniref:choice-of-anchor D domain-containing protein n=1 Tax=Winogradskyella wichelsiae TaxID=2697007 RepID=UPI003EF9AEE3
MFTSYKHSILLALFLCFTLSSYTQATLPLSRTIWDTPPTGWTDSSSDTYTSIFACSTSNSAKFNSDGQNKIVYFNTTPDELTFVTKTTALSSTSSLLVEESTDGISYTEVVELTSNLINLSMGCEFKGPYLLNSNTRYVKWTYTKPSIGGENMAIDDVEITAGVVGACTIASLGLTDIYCDDNLTVYPLLDDNITFKLNPTGTNLGTTYNVSVNGINSVSPTSGIYGVETDFTLQAGSAFNGDIIVTITDISGNCTQNVVLTNPGPCSGIIPTPTITVSQNTLSNLDYTYASGPSAEQSFDIEGLLLIAGIRVNAPTNFLISLTSGGPYTSTLDIPILPLNLANGTNTIYVVLEDGLEINTYSGTITTTYLTSGLTTTPSVSVSGEVTTGSSNPEIDIERNTGTSIPSGATANTTYNTVFLPTAIGVSEGPKDYYISNEGTADLTLTSITSSNSEFTITLNPAPTTITAGTEQAFQITYTPTAAGTSTATITIVSNDNNENPYTFQVSGIGQCMAGSIDLLPNTGPVGTTVNVTSTAANFGLSTTASIGGISANVNVISALEIEVTIPTGALTGSIEIYDDLGCLSYEVFTVVNNLIADCDGNSTTMPVNLFISEITDAGSGSHSYIEIYNGTGTSVNLNDYEIRIHNNGATSATATIELSGSLANDNAYLLAIGGENAEDPEGGFTADQFSNTGGVNDNDNIRLYFDDGTIETWVDLWGNTTGNAFTITSKDYTYRRKNSGITVPSTTWNTADWETITPVDYSDIRNFDFSTGEAPTITLQPLDTGTSCSLSASFTIAGTESYDETDDTKNLAYQWYYNAPGAATWTEILPSDTNYTGQQSANLITNNNYALKGYQYYCQLREDSATCYTASNAAKLEVLTSEWNGTNWSTAPTIDRVVILNENYNTTTEVSFSACRLIINAGKTLTITDSKYAEVYYDVTNNGTFNIENNGSLVQIDDNTTNTGNLSMERTTSIRKLDYVYWSTPIQGFNINDVSPASPTNKIYKWHPTVTNTNGSEGNWQSATGETMTPGVGYIIRGPEAYGTTLTDYTAIFNNGVPLNGTYTVPIARGSNPTTFDIIDDNWNLLGNPYPSAISADALLSTNTNLKGYINIWTHGTLPNNATSEPYYDYFSTNYNEEDYLTYNSTGPNTGPNTFDGTIAAAQGFMVNMVDGSATTDNVVFNNTMRNTALSNSGFYRTANVEKHRIWLDLVPEGESSKRILIGYIENATDEADRMYDAIAELSSVNNFYSIIDNQPYKIQGLQLPFNATDVIPLGIKATNTSNYTLGIHTVDGLFETESQTVYLKDNTLGITHNLSLQPYMFTLEEGTFNERFEIVFRQEDVLSTDDNVIDANTITITELHNGMVEFRIGNTHTIKQIAIIDITGRVIYNLKGNTSTEVYDLSKLSKAAYIAKITLSNGQVISKKAIKQH